MKEKLIEMLKGITADYANDPRYDHMAYVTNHITGMTEAAYVLTHTLKIKNAKEEVVAAVLDAVKDIADLATCVDVAADTMVAMHP